jgi:hypothetical protein
MADRVLRAYADFHVGVFLLVATFPGAASCRTLASSLRHFVAVSASLRKAQINQHLIFTYT